MNKLLLSLVLLAALALGAFYTLNLPAEAEEEKSSSATAEKPLQEVAVLKLQHQTINQTHSLPGRIKAFRQSEVRPQVDGIITQRMFQEGALVQKGQQLYQIDDTRYKALLSSANADLRSAYANLKAVSNREKRYQKLMKNNALSRQDYDNEVASLEQARAAIDVAKAKVQLAQVDVDFSKVYAPISGHISRSYVTEGALVTANQSQELATITTLDPVYVDMQQSASDQRLLALQDKLARDTEVPVHLLLERNNSEQAYQHVGRLKFAEVTMDQTTGSTTLRAEIPNPDAYLLPGMFVRAELELGKQQAILVPQRACSRSPLGELQVWIVDQNNSVHQRSIDSDSAYQDNWIVKNGVKSGDTLVIAGYQKLQENQQVNSISWHDTQPIPETEAQEQ